MLIDGLDSVVIAVELCKFPSSCFVAKEHLDVVIVEVEDLFLGDVAALDVVALVLDDFIRASPLGVELVGLVLGRIEL